MARIKHTAHDAGAHLRLRPRPEPIPSPMEGEEPILGPLEPIPDGPVRLQPRPNPIPGAMEGEEPIPGPVEGEEPRRKRRVSKSTRAGLVFPVTRIFKRLKTESYTPRLAQSASVYLAAVLEYLTHELLEKAGEVAKETKHARINPRHIQLAVKREDADPEFRELLGRYTIIAGSGAAPFIHSKLN